MIKKTTPLINQKSLWIWLLW